MSERKTPGDGFELWGLDSANMVMDWERWGSPDLRARSNP
jgi:hypothetical protein